MTDYKNTPEGKIVQQKYADLLSLSRPAPINPRMSTANRAKLFSPFAALRGYEDELKMEWREHLKENRIELSEYQRENLYRTLQKFQKGNTLTIKYFTDGYYEELTGKLEGMDPIYGELTLYTGTKNELGKELPAIISFEDIIEVYATSTIIG